MFRPKHSLEKAEMIRNLDMTAVSLQFEKELRWALRTLIEA